MTVLSRGARVRRSGRRPGWVLLTTLLVLAIGASSALVFTNRVELLKLAVILALWAAVAGAFVSVLYRRQADVDQARARDLKLVYDLQLDREISARREYELTVESQLRRELAVELRAAAADEIAALRAELSNLRTNLEILFDTDLDHRPALETPGRDMPAARALGDHQQNGAQPGAAAPADWVASDRINPVRQHDFVNRGDEAGIIDVPEVGVPPREREVPREVPAASGVGPLLPPRPPAHVQNYAAPPPDPAVVESRHRTPPPAPAPAPRAEPSQPVAPAAPKPAPPPTTPVEWQPAPAEGQWAPPGTPGSNWGSSNPSLAAQSPSGRRSRRHSETDDPGPFGAIEEPHVPPQYGGRRSRSRHSTEYRDFGIGRFGAHPPDPAMEEPVPRPPEAPPEPAEPRPEPPVAPPSPRPRLAPAPPPPAAARHRGTEPVPTEAAAADAAALHSDGQSVADLMARLQVQPSGEGRRRRRDG